MNRAAQRAAVLGGIAVAVAGLLVAPPPAHGADDDRILRIGTTQEFDSINPNLAFVASSGEASTLQYAPLVGLGPDMTYQPTGFAESWTNDGSTWTFTIRDGMRWSDGQTADADDVAFTYRYLLASLDPKYVGPWAPAGNDLPRAGATRADGRPDHPLSLYGDVLAQAAGLRSVQVVDAHTVTMTTSQPTTLLLGALVPILPEHIWATVPFAAAATDFQRDPPVVGSGPFQLAEWQRGSQARFVRNPLYSRATPYLEEVDFRFYPDAGALATALRNGEIDYARAIAPADADGLGRDPDIDVDEGFASGFTHLAFNTYAKPIDGGGASTAAVRDPRFRDALGYALDPEAIIERAVDGYASPATTLIPPAVASFHAEPSHPRTFDPAEAERRLTAAGYVDGDEDGAREDLDGRPIDLRLYYPTSDPRYLSAALAVAGQWERVGITVTSKGLEPDALAEQLYTPEAGGTAEYDVVLWSWTGSPDPDFLLSLLTTAEIGKWSDSSYANPTYDGLFEAQRGAATVEGRRSVVKKMLDLAYDDAPYLLLFYDDALDAHRTDRFGGWHEQGNATTPLFGADVQGYLDLGPAAAAPSATAAPTASPALAPASARPSAETSGGAILAAPGDVTLALAGVLVGVGALVLLLIGGRARRGARPGA
ncbi:MAG TPA: ABC transporter substrate-binding protein [Candidatus Limnocylindrales bacterium]|nr:ABC transporter substrate-binding protein [Candidatus Limnocylindrales bacterium]